jgi:hypothetical protein
MKMAYADHPKIFKLRLGLAEAMVSPATHVNKNPCLTVDPEEVTARRAKRIGSGPARTEDLHSYWIRRAALRKGVRTNQWD